MNKRKPKTTRLEVRIDDAVGVALAWLAKADRRSSSDMVRVLILDEYARRKAVSREAQTAS